MNRIERIFNEIYESAPAEWKAVCEREAAKLRAMEPDVLIATWRVRFARFAFQCEAFALNRTDENRAGLHVALEMLIEADRNCQAAGGTVKMDSLDGRHQRILNCARAIGDSMAKRSLADVAGGLYVLDQVLLTDFRQPPNPAA